jgi:hypothetical protein
VFRDIPYLLFMVIVMLTFVALIRKANQPRTRGRRRWQFSMQSLLLTTAIVAVLAGLIVVMTGH